MAVCTNPDPASAPRRWFWTSIVIVPAALVALCWWLTAPLVDPAPAALPAASVPVPVPATEAGPPEPVTSAETGPETPPPWPAGRVDGQEAKRLLLETLEAVNLRLDAIPGYTATLHKQERINGTLGPEQTLAMKVRHQPFAIYLKFLAPKEGKEVVYAEGHRDNKVIAHATGLSRWLVPRLAVAPDHPLALAETRHAVTEAGLANLTRTLLRFRKLDLDDPDAVTILDRTTDAQGRPWLRSIHTHSHHVSSRPFARVEVLYDPETRFPLQIRNYDWPEPGHTGDLLLAEQYRYEDLDTNVLLTALDFDPANPAYAFHRY